ncbi:hypothetical protein M9Y10_029556 [Tritrichomonas musculus]|uniref:Protein kinase domain-containing protein n=1 Tax=Tritrichomonas musculus TaxID=1915356 RepID=A0ABR2KMJ1_9EUKA
MCHDGSMFVITKSVFKSPNDEMKAFYLPNDEKPISIAVCIDCFVAVGSKGGVYESPLNRESICRLILLPIKELEGKSIINVSGYYRHVFAVSQDGKVFGRGNNSYNRLGFGKLYDNYDKFVIIPNLDKHKIISSYAGCGHSLFLTSEGKVLACGANHYGQCLLNKETNCYINQICETTITGYATFCIARNALSTVFLACDPPPNIPNQTINYDKDPVIPSTMTSNMKSSTNNKPLSTINSSTLGSPIEFSKLTSNPSTSKLQIFPNSDPHSIRSSFFPTMPNMNNIANKPIVPLNESYSPRLASNCTVKAPLIKVNLNVNAQESIMKQMIGKLKKENDLLKQEKASLREQISSKNKDYEIKHRIIQVLDAQTIRGYRIVREISYGSSGKVLEVVKEENFALKVMNIEDATIEKQQKFIQEYEKLNMLNHPNIIHTLGICMCGDSEMPPSILLEFCPINLQQAVKNSTLSKVDIAKYVYQIAEGMKYVHKCCLIHRDLKPSNILIGKDGLIRISDFGISKLMTTEEQSTTLGSGTQKFMAPEILNEKEYDYKADVYSFGVLLFFILTGGELPKITVIQVGNGIKAKISLTINHFSSSLINNCWNLDPKSRPSFEKICESIEINNYKVVELSISEVTEVRKFVEEHKKRIPKY